MHTQTAEKNHEDLAFERVWAIIQEVAESQKETGRLIRELREDSKETDRQMKETDRLIKELREDSKETDRRMKETDRRIGDLGNRFGELVEHLVAPSITEKFNELGFYFTKRSLDVDIREPGSPNACAEIDILLEDGDIVIAVEVKSKPRQSDVDEHVKRMELLRRMADRRQDSRKYQGAIAGAIMSQALRDYVIQTGFYLIEQTGDTVKLTIPEGFTPREW
jgi:hypothetical protein